MSIRRVVQVTASAPWSKRTQHIDEDDETRRPLLKLSSTSNTNPQLYGSTERYTQSPEGFRRDSGLGRVPEEGQSAEETPEPEPNSDTAEGITADEVEWALEEQGLYGGSYRRKVLLYTFAPLSTLLVFLGFALLPALFWVEDPLPVPHPPYFPFPFSELLVSISLWSLAHLVRLPLYTFTSWLLPRYPPFLVAATFNLIYALLSNVLRVSAFAILRIRHQMDHVFPTCRDFAFQRVWWLALGFTAFEAVTGIAQDYAQIALYKDVMIPEENITDMVNQENGSGSASRRGLVSTADEIHALNSRADGLMSPSLLSRVASNASVDPSHPNISRELSEELEREVDRDIEQLVRMKEREEVEEVYGIPVIRIPVFVLCLQRIDSIVVTVGATLILSACYLRSNISLPTSSLPPLSSNRPIAIAFPLICLLNILSALMYTPTVLPKVGIHTAAYIGVVVGLGVLFTGLGLWGALS